MVISLAVRFYTLGALDQNQDDAAHDQCDSDGDGEEESCFKLMVNQRTGDDHRQD